MIPWHPAFQVVVPYLNCGIASRINGGQCVIERDVERHRYDESR